MQIDSTFKSKIDVHAKSFRCVTKELGCSPTTVCAEYKRGATNTGTGTRYDPDLAQQDYECKQKLGGRTYDIARKKRFIAYVMQQFGDYGYSLDACVGRALLEGFSKHEIVCTKTLYNYVDRGLLEICYLDLPLKSKRKHKRAFPKQLKLKFGRSIEVRPEEVLSRTVFGNWEVDLVVGSKSSDDVVLFGAIERKTRYFMALRIKDKSLKT